MKKRVLFILAAFILLISMLFTGCQSSGGVPQADYDQVMSQLTDAQSQLSAAQSQLTDAQGQLTDAQAQLTDAQNTILSLNNQVASLNGQVEADRAAIQAKDDKLAYYESRVADLQSQLSALQAQYELTGDTPAETAEKIVSYYHETHVYSSYDLFVCSDMAAEVWNMLKAAGISSIIVVGRVDTSISDIIDSNHAWVLAEVSPGQYLALETTGGYSVSESENPLYYHGWSFDSPADLKSYNDLVQEYNTRVGFRNLLANEVNEAMSLYNNSSTQAEADKWLTLYDKLHDLQTDQEAILNDLMAQISSLAAVIQ
jgi:outer membrane murein-binding lipoprotein Lpp